MIDDSKFKIEIAEKSDDGKYGKFVRPTAFMFGSCIVLCNDEIYEMSNPEKPLMCDVNTIKRLLMWED